MTTTTTTKRPDLLDDSDNESDVIEDHHKQNTHSSSSSSLVINKRYAKDFQLRKQREDLRNHPELWKNDDDDDDASSSSSDEDEDGALLTTKLDTNIFKTINALRSKDKRIYDPNVRFFDSEEEEEEQDDDDDSTAKKKRKPKRYKDVIREQTLEQMEMDSDRDDESDDNDDDNDNKNRQLKSHRLVYDKEQEEIRKSFLQSTKDLDDTDNSNNNNDDNDDDDSDVDGLLVMKKKDPKVNAQEEEELMKELQRMEKQSKKDSSYVDPKGEVDDGSKFLLNYFKNRAWIDKDKMDSDDDDDDDDGGADNDVDSQAAIKAQLAQIQDATTDDTDEIIPMKTAKDDDHNDDDDASLDQLDKADDFEAQYNFRFEEAAGTQSGADFSLISYARGQTVNTLRRKDDSRREKRLARKERKAAERKAKEEELKRLKNLKRKEMERKLTEVKKVVGLAEHDTDLDEAAILKLIEGDYDPEEFEKKMQETFGDEFYSKEDKEWKSDKDVRDALMKDDDGNLIVGQDEEGDMYDTIEGDENDDDENAENTTTDIGEEEEWDDEEEQYNAEGEEGGEEETELEKKIKAKMEDELYKLDYEDIVAGMPTRFKYRQVEPNNYGLTTEEILYARDTTLKQFVSLKKMAPYREDGEFTVGGRRRRRFRDMLKHEIEEELRVAGKQNETKKSNQEETEPEEAEGTSKKRKRRRNKKSKTTEQDQVERKETQNEDTVGQMADAEKSTPVEEPAAVATTEEEGAEGEETKRKRRRRKKKKSASSGDNHAVSETDVAETSAKKESKEHQPQERQVKLSDETNTTESKDTSKQISKGDKKEVPKKAKTKDKKHKIGKKEERKRDKTEKKKKKKKSKKSHIEGISESRLSSYGL